jgi:hypothetical protein
MYFEKTSRANQVAPFEESEVTTFSHAVRNSLDEAVADMAASAAVRDSEFGVVFCEKNPHPDKANMTTDSKTALICE